MQTLSQVGIQISLVFAQELAKCRRLFTGGNRIETRRVERRHHDDKPRVRLNLHAIFSEVKRGGGTGLISPWCRCLGINNASGNGN